MALTFDDIEFDPTNMFASNATKRTDHKTRVRDEAPEWAVRAVIVNGLHTSRSDSTNHITVDYYNAAGEKTRLHVYA